MKHRFIVMLLPIIWLSIACGGGRRSAEEKSSEISGEQYGNYCAEWCLKDSKGRAGKELWLDVSYKGKAIFRKAVNYKDFPDIDSPEQYILTEPRSVHTDNALAFSDMIEDIRNDYPGENLCDLVLRMDFYNEAESSAQEYAALYAFCLYNNYEYAWEGFELLLYDMFVKYPEKFDDIHMTLRYLPDNQRQKILKRIMDMLTFEYGFRAETSSLPSFRQFVSMFPYFDKPEFEKIYFNPERP